MTLWGNLFIINYSNNNMEGDVGMMNKKAFTLVEMLAVIVLLGIVMALSYTKILEMVNKQNEDISEAQLELVYSAAKSYIFDNSDTYPGREGHIYCISIDTLENGNYLAIETDDLDKNKKVKISYFSDEEYQLTYAEKCEEKK